MQDSSWKPFRVVIGTEPEALFVPATTREEAEAKASRWRRELRREGCRGQPVRIEKVDR